MENTMKRPSTILESLEKGFKEIREFKQGKRKLKSLEESQQMWNAWIEETEDESK